MAYGLYEVRAERRDGVKAWRRVFRGPHAALRAAQPAIFSAMAAGLVDGDPAAVVQRVNFFPWRGDLWEHMAVLFAAVGTGAYGLPEILSDRRRGDEPDAVHYTRVFAGTAAAVLAAAPAKGTTMPAALDGNTAARVQGTAITPHPDDAAKAYLAVSFRLSTEFAE